MVLTSLNFQIQFVFKRQLSLRVKITEVGFPLTTERLGHFEGLKVKPIDVALVCTWDNSDN